MTTKLKIIGGFVIMMILMGGIAFMGYKDLGESSSRFLEYRRYVLVNVASSDILMNLGFAGTYANAYVLTHDGKNLEMSLQHMDTMDKMIGDTIDLSVIQKNKDTLSALRKMVVEYRDGLRKLGIAIDIMKKQYEDVVTPNGRAVAAMLDELADNATRAENVAGVSSIEKIWSQYGLMLSALGRYSYSRNPADMVAVEDRINQMRPLLEKAGSLLITAEGKVLHGKLMTAASAIFGAIADMKHNGEAANQQIGSLAALRGKFTNDLATFSSALNDDMRAIGTRNIEENEDGQRDMMMISGAGIIIATLLALFIIVGLVRVLTELSGFAGAIASGDFSRQIRTREKGEIGSMVTAMKNIPEVLQRVISDISKGVVTLQGGDYRGRLNSADYPGAYGNLVNSVNTVAEAYTTALDEIPIPILTADKAHSVHFANSAGQKVVGGNLIESFTKEGGTAFGKKAMEGGQNYSGETKIDYNGKAMHFAVTTVPLVSAGASVGFIEILTDLTEIRTQQQTILQVANQAAEISNRVAAASEELSAQVEQVSRGAEVQRDRVESTASAMTEMNATVLEVARSAGEASDQSEGTRIKATEGADLVNKVMTAINQVNKVSQNLHNNMQELGAQAESIGSVMNVISDIADQTNLLALNAAIEAARAGEAGRGFAVVADEVRKLAEKTMAATHEVGSSINAVQQSARVNIEEVGKAVSSVTEANELADSSGQALSEIVSLASANSAVVASIATAAEEQSATSEEISRAIDEINHIVGETAEGMVQSSAAVQDLSRMAQELRRVMEGLK